MKGAGFEALADGTMLLTVLLVASTLILSLAKAPPSVPALAGNYAEDTRVALFRSTMDGLAFTQDGAHVLLPNGTAVEEFLLLEVHLVSRNVGDLSFDEPNGRITEIASALVRPGWSWAVAGRLAEGPGVVLLPTDIALPETYTASHWSYPALDGSGPDIVLSLFMWLSPRR